MQSLIQILQEQKNVTVIDTLYPIFEFIEIDLSATNSEIDYSKLNSSKDFENYIENYLHKNYAKVAFGGYNETRNLYKRSAIFNQNDENERNIHIGLDLWVKVGTKVLAALEGSIHSFKNNSGLGNYGPTIILEHHVKKQKFYTLYGHLSLENLSNKNIGDKIAKGQIIGELGNASVNGDYAPHLHFQIIQDIQNFEGDYPGVCNANELDFYLSNCPDPNLLLKIKT